MLAVFIIDCAEPTVLRALAAQGRMPVLAGLMAWGATLSLRSDAHVLDGSVFQTLLTGVNPGEHGIYKYVQLMPGTYRYRHSRAGLSPVPQIWTVLAQRGRTSCVFDVPKAFPTPAFRGALVNCWGAYSPAAEPASAPPALRKDILRRFGRHPQPGQEPFPLPPHRYEAIRDRLMRGAEVRADICRHLLRSGPWDFFITAFCESHVAAHQFWHLRDMRHPMFDTRSAAVCGDAIERVYAAVDEALGRMLGELPADATIVVLTQQGVVSNFSGSHLVPAWLARREGGRALRPLRNRLFRLVAAAGADLRSQVSAALPEAVKELWLPRKYPPRGSVFMLPGSEFMALLRVNLAGREPAGIVPPGSYRYVIEALRTDLMALRNPRTGKAAVADVVFLHDVYTGRCVDALPDVAVLWANDAPVESLQCCKAGLVSDGLKFLEMTHSCHTGTGLAVAAGPSVRKGDAGGPHSLQDLTATLYALLGEEPPPHLEGVPLGLAHSGAVPE